jgi:pimeloyl-ACP methyl ester carboxylesterase
VNQSKTATGDFKQIMSSTEALEDLAPLIRIPVLLQWGSKDFAVDVSGAEILKTKFHNLTVHVQTDVGHLPMLETPQASCGFFTEFYKRHIAQPSEKSIAPESGNLS